MRDVNFNVHYRENEDYDIETRLVKIDLEKEARYDIATNRGFRITTNEGPKKDIISETSIYSNKYGETSYGENPHITRYKCACGKTMGSKYENTYCPECRTKVVFVDDDFNYFGHLILDDYKVIHPILFNQLSGLIGKTVFNNIIKLDIKKDEDGNVIPDQDKPSKEPFFGIGMVQFRRRFYEILEYYGAKAKSENKINLYNQIKEDVDIVFTDSIPVFTIHLRPIKVENGQFQYDSTNDLYNMISKNVILLNAKKFKPTDTRTAKLLYDIQMNMMDLYNELVDTLKSKTGDVRNVFGGRYNFTARAVITPKPGRVDELELPYIALSELLEQAIINVLVKTNSISPNDARTIWEKAKSSENSQERVIVKNIINNIIKNSSGGRGIPVLLNRNPTIEFGSIQQFFVTSMNEHYSIGIPLQNLEFYAADFDGDELNVMYITNAAFREAAIKIFNPRNAFYVSHNDGYLNNSIIHNKDLLVNINSLRLMTNYSDSQLNAIRKCLDYK